MCSLGLVLGAGGVGVAVDEIAGDRGRGRPPVRSLEPLAVRRHRVGLVFPRPLAEHDHPSAEIGGREDGVGRHGDAVEAVAERAGRRRADRGAGLAVVGAVAFDPSALERVHHHARRLVEAVARLVHGDAEPLVLPAGQPPPDTEQHPPAGEVVEQRDLLGDAHGIVPRKDHRPGPEQDALGPCRHVGEEHDVVGAERVVLEVVLDGPQGVETEGVGQHPQTHLLGDDLPVGDVGTVATGLEHHLDPDVHSRSSCIGRVRWREHAIEM